MIRIAVVGLGFMGKTHIGIYTRLNRAEVGALCDYRQEALDIRSLDAGGNIATAAGSVDLSGANRYTDFDAMLADGGFDAVDLCVPTFLHADFAVKALRAGYHVFCEKPLALTAEETKRILDTIEETGKLFSVGQCLRYWPAYRKIKEILDDRRYGSVRSADFTRLSNLPEWSWKNWVIDGKLSGNAALDLHIHDVDMVLHLFGLPGSVRSSGVRDRDGGFSHIATHYGYRNMVVTSSGGWIVPKAYGFNMKAFLILEKASVELDFKKQSVLTVYPEEGEAFSPDLQPEDGYYYELEDFVNGIGQGRLSGLVTAESAAASVRLCLEEIRSAREGREISL